MSYQAFVIRSLSKNNVRNIKCMTMLIFGQFFDFEQNVYSRTTLWLLVCFLRPEKRTVNPSSCTLAMLNLNPFALRGNLCKNYSTINRGHN